MLGSLYSEYADGGMDEPCEGTGHDQKRERERARATVRNSDEQREELYGH